ncbi:MAG: 3-dehydroquinate synthase [Bacteroidetes bacterium]|nr:3-dehydroquinate synthase [Bacteroidota bacterium]MBI3482835.1 3-dehydroquinate synthase [Bacteroidota bacterium]
MESGSVIFSNENIDFKGLTAYSKIAILTDSNIRKHCYPLIQNLLAGHPLIEVHAGEEHKNLDTCKLIWQGLTDLNLDRHSLLVVLGGGVLGDMGGFCAATFKRGIDFILMPTTLLSQVDASIGGKLGIDFNNFKNHIGVFHEPKATILHSPFLKTLPERELRSGFAEVIKHCLISDEPMWQTIRKKKLNDQDWETLVKHSIGFKKSVTEKDPKEKGLRKILNFGHTIGHALESYFLAEGNRIFHGEAIAMGMVMESYIACEKKMIDQKQLDEVTSYLIEIFEKQDMPWGDSLVIQLIAQDKKNKGNEILMALPEGIGKARWDITVNEEELEKSFDFYRSI